jgi:hypothetical protein
MRFYQAAKPYIDEKLTKASEAAERREYDKSFTMLEDAHVIGQQSTYFHTLVHFRMLQHGLWLHDYKEVFGQLLRLIGALTKTAMGFIPAGNTGGVNVNPFKSMPVSQQNQTILSKIKHAQS